MNRLLKPRRESGAKKRLTEEPERKASDTSGSGLRKLLLGLGFAGLAYLAARRVRTSESAPSMDEVRETVGDVRSGEGLEIPIGEGGAVTAESDVSEGDEDREAAGETDETETRETGTTEGAIGNEPMPGEDISDDEIEERAEEDAREEPMEPGEMAVDEELAEDVIDEEEAGEAGGTEAGEADEGEAGEAEADEAATTEGEATDESDDEANQ